MSEAYIFVVLPNGIAAADARFSKYITEPRRERMARLKNERGRALSLCAHIAACCAFKLLRGSAPDYTYDADGRPVSPTLCIGLSHTEGAGVCIAADFPVSVDAETRRELPEGVACRLMSPRELRSYREGDVRAVMEAWTAKECAVKLTEGGRRLEFRRIETRRRRLDLPDGHGALFLRRFETPELFICAAARRRFSARTVFLSPEEALAILG